MKYKIIPISFSGDSRNDYIGRILDRFQERVPRFFEGTGIGKMRGEARKRDGKNAMPISKAQQAEKEIRHCGPTHLFNPKIEKRFLLKTPPVFFMPGIDP
jgi:hypothetical protein